MMTERTAKSEVRQRCQLFKLVFERAGGEVNC